jgi:hypothetical protein
MPFIQKRDWYETEQNGNKLKYLVRMYKYCDIQLSSIKSLASPQINRSNGFLYTCHVHTNV